MKVNKKEILHVLSIIKSRYPQFESWELDTSLSKGSFRIVDNKGGQFYPLGKYLRNAREMFEVLDSTVDLLIYMKGKENAKI